MNKKRSTTACLIAAIALALVTIQTDAADIMVSADITVNTTWVSSNVYKLDRTIAVRNGATLTIQAGTVVRGLPIGPHLFEPGTLLITRGSKINAQGTAANPIVFTDQHDDNIGANPGSVVNGKDYGKLNNQLTGQWGGLVLAGRSYIAWDPIGGVYAPDPRIQTLCEGLISSTDADVYYGGNNDNDNSGILKYVSIRYGGFLNGPSKEINGLTLCGVGRNTVVNHIDIYNTKDDVIECFGGTAGMKHLLAWNGTDDQLDTDTGWRGKAQFVLMVQGVSTNVGPGQRPDVGDKALEWDGAGDASGIIEDPASCGTLFNHTFVGMGKACGDTANTFANFRDNAGGRVYNGIVMDFAGGCTLIEGQPTGVWPYRGNCSAMQLSQLYGQDSYYTSGTNKQGVVLTNYIGYADAYAPYIGGVQVPSKKLEIKRNVFWNMGIPHSVGMTTNPGGYASSSSRGKQLVGTDNLRFSTHMHYGNFPDNTGYDIVAVDGNAAFDNTSLPAPSLTPVNYYERETTVYNIKPTFRTNSFPYTCVKKIDPRANTNFWAILATYGVKPPEDGFYTPVQFAGAMGKKNWAGPWSTPWRLGGMVTNGVPTGDETGIVPTVTTGAGVINLGLSCDTYAGIDADWWVTAIKSTGEVYYFNLTTGAWMPGLVPALQAPLFDLSPAVTISTAGLPAGSYTAYFAVDLNKDGLLTWDSLYAGGKAFTR